MDIEKGRSSRGATTSRLFAVTSTLMSCVALAGMVVLFVQNQQMQANVKQISAPKNVRIPDAARQERALQEVHEEHLRESRGTATATSYACQTRRREDYYRDCSDSPITPNSIPSAHIVPDGTQHYACTIEAPTTYFYTFISVGWSCGSTNDRVLLPGYVRGGMTFDRETGALIVPVEGIYFVYSQVHVNVSNPSQVVPTGTQTFICETERCRSTAYLESKALTDLTRAPYYHGGLFHLNANSTIKVAAWYDVTVGADDNPLVESRADSLAYYNHFTNTFFGAYLLEEIDPDTE